MNQANGPRPQLILGDFTPTTTASKPRRGCKVALLAGSPHLTQEIASLLRKRLRLASLIMVCAFASFTTLSFFKPPDGVGPLAHYRMLQLSTLFVLAALALTLWSKIQ